MSIGEKVNTRLGAIKTVIYGRTAMILLGFLAQLLMLGVGYILLRNYSYLFYFLFIKFQLIHTKKHNGRKQGNSCDAPSNGTC